jgi:hypothetical protein
VNLPLQITTPGAGQVVVGVGGCGLDYLAAVATYPKPDEKLRTTKLEVMGQANRITDDLLRVSAP